mgnify:CR=1 FL=1
MTWGAAGWFILASFFIGAGMTSAALNHLTGSPLDAGSYTAAGIGCLALGRTYLKRGEK